jgi:nucleoside-specific outer membrane channel protein Tsx
MMFKLAALLMISGSFVGNAHALDLQWQSNSFSQLHGNNYEVGDKQRDIVTFEHSSGWSAGDLFIFADFTDPLLDDRQNYLEIHPRLSLGKISGKDFSFGIVKDVLLAGEVEIGSNDHKAWLYGVGVDLDIPHFDYFSLNVYARDQANLNGVSYQISPAWSLPLEFGKTRVLVDGFADIDGGQGHRKASILFVPQVMLDVGHYWQQDNTILIGAEWQYWNNKFGIQNIDESVFQTLIKLKF